MGRSALGKSRVDRTEDAAPETLSRFAGEGIRLEGLSRHFLPVLFEERQSVSLADRRTVANRPPASGS
ncbi:hypothetical protein BN2476_560112 [Paraburkholderia piptadeniae]|uniref:Uncharacterized protein n=1 Tax=Paraburkholderia piptadeniae TaxID=1701573 RepID=A0A1N7SK40_9BURK|nr:hypothetical protein BN2476_560112 [Paraburkholderia piptadeniae]